MSRCFYLIVLVLLFAKAESYCQPKRFIVKVTPFSSRIYDEFSPVFYKGGIVFCSDQSDNSLVSYNNGQNRLFKIFYAKRKDITGWARPKILAREITTNFNDGPVTLNEKENIIYYSRNNSIENSLRNISDSSNKLGIFSAELIDGVWTNIKPFAYNNPKYSFCTPALTPDGERIYFSSDMSGGSGGMDLYYCNRSNNDWDRPVNLGPVINTSKNESFPFACKFGKLYFASDGHRGFGGKDLYYTQEINGEWISPVHLDSAINSPADDFGLVTDSTFENGYFSSNRRKTDDIYSFNSAPIEFSNCDSIKENNYCFTFYDEQHRLIDTIKATYKWDFGDGIIRIGKEVKHCFPGPGEYLVRLTIIDELTGDTIARQVNYKVELEKTEQPYISGSDVGLVNKSISLDAAETNLKNFKITDYLWNFGDGFKPGGQYMSNTFKKKGEYTVQLGLLAEADSSGLIPGRCVLKKIRIYNSFQELALTGRKGAKGANEGTDSVLNQTKTIQLRIYFMEDISEREKVKIEESLKATANPVVSFDKFGLRPESYQFLDKVAVILKDNPDIRLELFTTAFTDRTESVKMEQSEKWAQELGFFLKNKGVDTNAFSSKSFSKSNRGLASLVSENIVIDGEIEFIFIKN